MSFGAEKIEMMAICSENPAWGGGECVMSRQSGSVFSCIYCGRPGSCSENPEWCNMVQNYEDGFYYCTECKRRG